MSEKQAKIDPFEFVKNINTKSELYDDDLVDKEYDAWIVNRVFSNTPDTLLLANEMNMMSSIDRVMQYHFYYFGVDKHPKRYGQWHKQTKDSRIAVIKEYFGYSETKARQVLPLLADKLDEIQQELYKGGRNGKSRSN